MPILASSVTYKVCYAGEDFISIAFEDYSYQGSQEAFQADLRTINIGLKDGKIYQVKDVVNLDEAFAADWLEEMRGEAENEEFLSELSTQQMLAALGGDTINGVYTANFFVHADGIEIGYDLNYPADDPHDLGYIWVTAPFTFEEIASYASDSGFWNNIDVYAQ